MVTRCNGWDNHKGICPLTCPRDCAHTAGVFRRCLCIVGFYFLFVQPPVCRKPLGFSFIFGILPGFCVLPFFCSGTIVWGLHPLNHPSTHNVVGGTPVRALLFLAAVLYTSDFSSPFRTLLRKFLILALAYSLFFVVAFCWSHNVLVWEGLHTPLSGFCGAHLHHKLGLWESPA